MRTTAIVGLIAVFALSVWSTANAQLIAAKDGPIVYGHHHLNVNNVDEHKKFWVDTLGGTPVAFGNSEIVKFTNVLLFMRVQEPTGGSKGTTVNHMGFTVPNLRASLDKVEAAGFPVVTKAEVPPQYAVKDGIAYSTVQDSYLAFVMAPDGVKVELTESTSQTVPAKLHHIHFVTQAVDEMKAWYVETLNATPGMRGNFEAADLPGVNLTYSPSSVPVARTQGRSFDHIGFEVDGLKQFCEGLEAQGITFDIPYREIESLGISIAFFTDPFGTYVELTEGLDKL